MEQVISQNKYKKNIYLYYIYSFFRSMAFQRGIFILYLTELGFSNARIGLLQSLLFFSSFLSEFPTGYLGDKYGRKWSVLCGSFLLLLCGIGMVSFSKYYAFIIIFTLNGIALSFISGSDSAMLYDSLKFSGDEEKYLKINSRISSINSIVLGISILLGGYMKLVSWNMVYISYSIAIFVAFVAVTFMYENKLDFQGDLSEAKTEDSMISIIKYFFLDNSNKLLLLFVVSYGLFESAMTPFFIYGQKLFYFYNLKINQVSLIYSIIQFTSGIAFLFAEKVSERFHIKRLIIIITSLIAVMLLINAAHNVYLAIAMFYAINVNAEILFIVKDAYIQENIPSRIRASLLSFFSFVEVLLTSLIYLVVGYFMDRIKVNYAISMLSIIPVLSLMMFSIFFYKKAKHSAIIENSNNKLVNNEV